MTGIYTFYSAPPKLRASVSDCNLDTENDRLFYFQPSLHPGVILRRFGTEFVLRFHTPFQLSVWQSGRRLKVLDLKKRSMSVFHNDTTTDISETALTVGTQAEGTCYQACASCPKMPYVAGVYSVIDDVLPPAFVALQTSLLSQPFEMTAHGWWNKHRQVVFGARQEGDIVHVGAFEPEHKFQLQGLGERWNFCTRIVHIGMFKGQNAHGHGRTFTFASEVKPTHIIQNYRHTHKFRGSCTEYGRWDKGQCKVGVYGRMPLMPAEQLIQLNTLRQFIKATETQV